MEDAQVGSVEEPWTAQSVPADPASRSCPGPRAAIGTVGQMTQLAAGALSVTAASSAALWVAVIQVASNQGQQWSGLVRANVFFRIENQAQLVSGAWLMLVNPLSCRTNHSEQQQAVLGMEWIVQICVV